MGDQIRVENGERARETENQRATGGQVTSRLKEIGARPAAALADDAPILKYIRAVDAHLGIRSRLDCLYRRQYPPVAGHAGHRYRRRRRRRRRPHLARMVPARGAGPRPEAHLPADAPIARASTARPGSNGR